MRRKEPGPILLISSGCIKRYHWKGKKNFPSSRCLRWTFIKANRKKSSKIDWKTSVPTEWFSRSLVIMQILLRMSFLDVTKMGDNFQNRKPNLSGKLFTVGQLQLGHFNIFSSRCWWICHLHPLVKGIRYYQSLVNFTLDLAAEKPHRGTDLRQMKSLHFTWTLH